MNCMKQQPRSESQLEEHFQLWKKSRERLTEAEEVLEKAVEKLANDISISVNLKEHLILRAEALELTARSLQNLQIGGRVVQLKEGCAERALKMRRKEDLTQEEQGKCEGCLWLAKEETA